MTALLERWTGLVFLSPVWLLLAAAAPLLPLLLRRRAGAAALRLSTAPLLAGLPPTARTRLAALPPILGALGLALAGVALARPAERVPLPRDAEGIDILLALDVSSSMTSPGLDGRRSRLETVKAAAAEFVRARPEDRIGLLAFARYPELLCPPTLDHGALLRILAGAPAVEADGPEDATGIGAAAARAAQALRSGSGRSRVVVLLTDGEENVAATGEPSAVAPVHAGQLCAALGVRVYAISAVGGPGAGLPPGARQVPGDPTGPVRRMALRTGGRFFEARDAAALAEVYRSIDALERARAERPRFAFEERFVPFLLAALGLLLGGRLLRAGPLGVLP